MPASFCSFCVRRLSIHGMSDGLQRYFPWCSPGPARIFVAAVSLTSFTLVQYQSTGLWTLSPWILAMEYVPVVVFIFFEFRKDRRISHDAR